MRQLGTIRQRGRKYQARIKYQGTAHEYSFKTQAAAESWLASQNTRIAKGLSIESPTDTIEGGLHTLSALQQAATARYWSTGSGGPTQSTYAQEVITLLGPALHPSEVDATSVDYLISRLRDKGNKDSTINRKLSALRKMLRHAWERGIISGMPPIQTLKETNHRLRWFTRDEEQRILSWLESENQIEQRDFFIFLIETGARAGEAGAIRWRDVDFDSLMVEFHHTKTNKSRGVPLTERVEDLLRGLASMKLHGTDPMAHVFPSMSRESYRLALTRLLGKRGFKACGIEDDEACVHTCRHTFGSRLAQQGTPIQVISELMGHSTIQMTMRYAHLTPKQHSQWLRPKQADIIRKIGSSS